jgi:ATP-dependent Clp protease protease subunit
MKKEMTDNYYSSPMFRDNIVEEMKVTSATRHRTIYMSETVTDDSCFKLNYYLDRIARIDKIEGKKEPITIVVSSFGGSLYDALSVISRIERMIEDGYEIVSIIDGYSMSAGSAISQVCSKRYARRYSTILYHQLSSYTAGTLAEMSVQHKENERLWELMKEITKKHTKMTDEYLDNIFNANKDVYLTPQQALELGVIDEIL